MFERFSTDGRDAVRAALEEARRRGDRYIGTEHLLLGTLADPAGVCPAAVGIDLPTARLGLAWLDDHALAALGIAADLEPVSRPPSWRSRLPMTSGAKSVLQRAVQQAVRLGEPRIEARHLLLAILDADEHDQALRVLRHLGRDPDEIRDRLVPVVAE